MFSFKYHCFLKSLKFLLIRKTGLTSLKISSKIKKFKDFFVMKTIYYEKFNGCLRLYFYRNDKNLIPMESINFLLDYFILIFLLKISENRFITNLSLKILKNPFI